MRAHAWATETARYVALLRSVVESARVLLDQTDDASVAATTLADRFDDLDAYCPRCDDAGVITRRLGGEPTSPPVFDEVPCSCEASRILAAQRADIRRRAASIDTAAVRTAIEEELECLDCLARPCRCVFVEGDLEDQFDALLAPETEPADA